MRSRVTARSTAAVVAGFVALSATAAVAQETIFEQSFSVQDGALLATELVEMDINEAVRVLLPNGHHS